MKRTILICAAILPVLCLAGCFNNRVSKAEELIKVKSYDQAITLLQEEIRDTPKNAEAHQLLGQIYSEKRDWQKARESFDSAVLADPSFKRRIIDKLASGQPNHEATQYMTTLDIEYIKSNEKLAYLCFVETGPASDAGRFASYFPKSPRAPTAIDFQADGEMKRGNSRSAKRLYQSLVERYPRSHEAENARRMLSDWWTEVIIRLPVDNSWHGAPVQKGQRYRYQVIETTTVNLGIFGNIPVDGDHIKMFIGSRQDLHDMMDPYKNPTLVKEMNMPNITNSTNTRYHQVELFKQETVYCRDRGRGIAPRSGYVWFEVDAGAVIYKDRFAAVKLWIKD